MTDNLGQSDGVLSYERSIKRLYAKSSPLVLFTNDSARIPGNRHLVLDAPTLGGTHLVNVVGDLEMI